MSTFVRLRRGRRRAAAARAFPRAYLDLNREPYELDRACSTATARLRQYALAARRGGTRHHPPGRRRRPRDLRGQASGRGLRASRVSTSPITRRCARSWSARDGGSAWPLSIAIPCRRLRARSRRDARAKSARSRFRHRRPLRAPVATRDSSTTFERRLRRVAIIVQRNRPYAGGFITEHYGRPGADWHALQIEVARGLYMNEATAPMSDSRRSPRIWARPSRRSRSELPASVAARAAAAE